jgi:3-oxoacyl-[acyl-carrier protein] reductase
MFSLEGRVALITGASGGIGQEVAKAFHALGATVVLSGTRAGVLQEIADQLGSRAFVVTANLSDLGEVETLVDRAVEAAGGLDILVCNAGLNRDGLALRMKDEDWDAVLNVNLKATFKLNQAAIKYMMKKKYGRIINISSVVAFTGNFGQANYVASKAGMVGMTKTLAQEIAAKGVTVNCVAPGFIKTPMTDKLGDNLKEGLLRKIPAGRMGEPAEIASAVVFLASSEASYMTGTTLHVNGGMYM